MGELSSACSRDNPAKLTSESRTLPLTPARGPGIAMAQLCDLVRAKALLRSVARVFGPKTGRGPRKVRRRRGRDHARLARLGLACEDAREEVARLLGTIMTACAAFFGAAASKMRVRMRRLP